MHTIICSDVIEIVGSLDPARVIDREIIVNVLQQKEQSLKHGEKFTGRPSTRIFASDQYIIKFKSEFNFKVVEARRWITRTIELERLYGIYHPEKTWFIIQSDDGGIIANATPLLKPLHLLYESLPADVLLNLLFTINNHYFEMAKKHDKRLDEGLSNFAIDDLGNLYYLDDDIYEWGDFTALSNAVGMLTRKLNSLSLSQWEQLGENIRFHILRYFEDSHCITILVEQLKSMFVANEQQLAFRSSLISGLNNRKTYALTPPVSKITEDRIAVLADMHANLPALEVVLARLRDLGINEGIVLGDIVGYGPHPAECIELLANSGFCVIKGNHDNAVATGNVSRGFSSLAGWAVDWSRNILSTSHKTWLEDLPPYLTYDNWLAVHGAPLDKTFFNAYVYRMTYEENLNYLQEHGIAVCFHGHTHTQTIYTRERNGDKLTGGVDINLDKNISSLICPGSVGKTRSEAPLAEFCIFNRKSLEVKFERLEYDLAKTLADMQRFSFPEQLIERLRDGQ